MKRISILLLLGSAALAGLLHCPAVILAQAGKAEAAEPAVVPPEKALASTVQKLEFENAALESVMDYLRVLSKTNIVVKWSALQTVGIDPSTPVTIRLANVRLDKALRMILDQVGVINPVDYAVDDNILVISTLDDLSTPAWAQMRVYDIRELAHWTSEEEVDELIEIITDSIDPNSWHPAGTGSIGQMGGQLIVTQSSRNHRQIEQLLEKLKAAQISRVRATPKAMASQADVQIKLVGTMKETVYDPAAMGLIAISGLRDEIPQEPEKAIDALEELLAETKTLGLRNAIRLALKDLYRATGQFDKAAYNFRRMLQENDTAKQDPATTYTEALGRILKEQRNLPTPFLRNAGD